MNLRVCVIDKKRLPSSLVVDLFILQPSSFILDKGAPIAAQA
jgi:hypothetical protein